MDSRQLRSSTTSNGGRDVLPHRGPAEKQTQQTNLLSPSGKTRSKKKVTLDESLNQTLTFDEFGVVDDQIDAVDSHDDGTSTSSVTKVLASPMVVGRSRCWQHVCKYLLLFLPPTVAILTYLYLFNENFANMFK